jgi:hypothetical protein
MGTSVIIAPYEVLKSVLGLEFTFCRYHTRSSTVWARFGDCREIGEHRADFRELERSSNGLETKLLQRLPASEHAEAGECR